MNAITPGQALAVGNAIGVDWRFVDLEQFRQGIMVELEHGARDPQTNATNDDWILTGKIALAHLKELPDYYTRLTAMEQGTISSQAAPAPVRKLATPAAYPMAPGVPPRFFNPVPIPQDRFTSLGFTAATLAIASAASIGANMADVHNGAMTRGQAVGNGLVKGAAASVILSLTPKQTVLDIALTAAALAGAGYAIDRTFKKVGVADRQKAKTDS